MQKSEKSKVRPASGVCSTQALVQICIIEYRRNIPFSRMHDFQKKKLFSKYFLYPSKNRPFVTVSFFSDLILVLLLDLFFEKAIVNVHCHSIKFVHVESLPTEILPSHTHFGTPTLAHLFQNPHAFYIK